MVRRFGAKLLVACLLLGAFAVRANAQRVALAHEEFYENAGFSLVVDSPESLVSIEGLTAIEGDARLAQDGQVRQSYSRNGTRSVNYRYIYRFVAGERGEVVIGPFSLKGRDRSYEVPAVRGSVVANPDFGVPGHVSTGNRRLDADLAGMVFTAVNAPEEVWYGEPFELKTMLYMNSAALQKTFGQTSLAGANFSLRSVEPSANPALLAVEASRRAAGGGGDAPLPREIVIDGATYTEHPVAVSPVVPVQTGNAVLNGARIVLDPPLSARMFGNFPALSAAAPSKPFHVKELPAPPDGVLAQIVGQITLGELSADRLELVEGDPFTLKLIVSGRGMLGGLSLDDLPDPEGFEPFPGSSEREVTFVREEGDPFLQQAGLSRTYRATRAGRFEIPPVRLAVIDPETGRQTVQASNALVVEVAAREGGVSSVSARVVAEPDRPGARVVGKDSVRHIETAPIEGPAPTNGGRPLYRNPVFLGGNGTLFLAACLVWGVEARKRRIQSDPNRGRAWNCRRRANERLDAAESAAREPGGSAEAFAAIAQALREAVASVGDREPAGLTLDEIDAILAKRGHGGDLRGDVSALLAKCDSVRYAPAAGADDVRASVESARRIAKRIMEGAG